LLECRQRHWSCDRRW